MAMQSSPMSRSRLEGGLRPEGPPPPHEEVPRFMVYMNVISTVTHLLLGSVAFVAFILANITGLTYPKFTAHAYLTVIGYTMLVCQAIFSLNPQTGWANNFKYPQKTMTFWSFQVLGSFLAILGCIMAFVALKEVKDLNFPGVDHLKSNHSIVGFIAMLLTTVSLVGALAHMFNNSIKNNGMLKAIHSCTLTLTLVMAFIAICFWFHNTRGFLQDASTNMVIAFTVLTLVGMFTMMACNKSVGGRFLI